MIGVLTIKMMTETVMLPMLLRTMKGEMMHGWGRMILEWYFCLQFVFYYIGGLMYVCWDRGVTWWREMVGAA